MRVVERRIKRAAVRLLGSLSSGQKMSPGDMDLRSLRRILLVKQHDQLGDFLLFTPVISAVRKRFPHARVALCTRGYTKDAVLDDPRVDQLIVVEERLDHVRPASMMRSLSCLLPRSDLAVVFNTISHSFTSDMIAMLSRARYRLGPSEPKMPGAPGNPFYNVEVSVPESRVHMTEKYLSIVEPIGALDEDGLEKMYIGARCRTEALQLLASWGVTPQTLLFAMHPGGARNYTRWPLEKYAVLGDRLSSLPNARVVVIVGRREAYGEEVAQRMKAGPIVSRVTDLRLLAAILARVDVYIGNDTGLLHVASAVGTKAVGIYGETDPAVWKPKGSHVVAVRPDDKSIGSVSVDDVYEAVERFLE